MAKPSMSSDEPQGCGGSRPPPRNRWTRDRRSPEQLHPGTLGARDAAGFSGRDGWRESSLT